MSSTHDVHTTVKKEEISQEIKELEIQIMAEREKLSSAEYDQKLEDHKRNFLEARKDELKKNIEYYKINVKKMRKKLAQRSIIHSQFSMAEQCYNKLLKICEENYLQTESQIQRHTMQGKEMSVPHKYVMGFQKQAENLQKESELLKARIEEKYFALNNLLESLQFPDE